MIERGGHDVPNLAAGTWSVLQGVKPLLDLRRANLCDPLVAPLGFNVALQIDLVRFEGGKSLALWSELMVSIVGLNI